MENVDYDFRCVLRVVARRIIGGAFLSPCLIPAANFLARIGCGVEGISSVLELIKVLLIMCELFPLTSFLLRRISENNHIKIKAKKE